MYQHQANQFHAWFLVTAEAEQLHAWVLVTAEAEQLVCSAVRGTWVDLDGLWQGSVTIGGDAGWAHHDQLIPLLHQGVRGGVDQAPVASRVHLTHGAYTVGG